MKFNRRQKEYIVKLFLRNKTSLIFYLVVCPLSCICSILFALTLEPILRAGMGADIFWLLRASVFSLVVAGLDILLSILLHRVRFALVQECANTLRRDLMKGILSIPANEFVLRDVAGYTTLFSNHTERIKDLLLSNLCRIHEQIWSLLLAMVALVFVSPFMGAFLIAIGILSVLIPHLFERGIKERQKIQMEKAENHLGTLRDIFLGYWIIKNHCVEKQFQKKYESISNELSQADFQNEYYPYMTSMISSGITTVSFIGIISIGAYLVINNQISVTLILSLSQLIGSVLAPMELLPQYVSQVKGANSVMEELIPYTKKKGILTDDTLFNESIDWNTMDFDLINFRYGDESDNILRDVSLQIERGKKYVLIGESGSGKSTLAKILAGIIPCKFQFKIDGKAVDGAVLPKYVSYMEQASFLFRDTIYENISLYRGFRREIVEKMLDSMNFGVNLIGRGNLLDIAVGESGMQLSGGERQRVALARELLGRKDILILDESMSSVDQTTTEELEKVVMNLKGVTCLLITHHLDSYLLSRCDYLLSIECGKLICKKMFNSDSAT